MHTNVVLHAFNPNWAQQYIEEKQQILTAIGPFVLGIEHIGSTSIEGMKAKPIIDMIVGIHDITAVPQLIQPLQQVQFEYVPKLEWPDRAFFRKGLWGQGTCHVHICEINSQQWHEKLLFRDYLRLHAEAARAYASLKEQLAAQYASDRHAYTAHKEPFIRAIIDKANSK